MAELRNVQSHAGMGARTYDASIDQGLRAYMVRVYNLMALAMGITALFAAGTVMLATGGTAVATLPSGDTLNSFGALIYGSPLRWVIMLAPLAIVFMISFRINSLSPAAAQGWFWAFAALIGMSMSSIFLVYTSASIVQTFFITATAFGALSLYGYTTKRDLTGMGSFLIMGLVGLILAMIVNIFLQSGAMQFAISVIGVLIFAGLTAYDTQKIKEMYYVGDGAAVVEKKAIMGALALYLDFINMFQFLLYFLGNRE